MIELTPFTKIDLSDYLVDNKELLVTGCIKISFKAKKENECKE